MRDYGFATYDEKSGKRKEGSVNSKWPIFGPKYADIKHAFRTIHFTDTKQYPIRTSSAVSLPSVTSATYYYQNVISQFHGYEKILVATIPHGFDKRPVGYCTISGNFVKNKRCRWEYTKATDYYNLWPPAVTLNAVHTKTGPMASYMGSELEAIPIDYNTKDMPVFMNNSYDGITRTGSIDEPAVAYPNGTYWYLSQNAYQIPGENSSVADSTAKSRPPYSVEVDDTNVYLYRYYYWSDVYKRGYYKDDTRVSSDIRAREKAVIDYAGSEFDLTLYFCPYTFDDLLPKQYVAPILNVGIWDNDNWDNGKVYGI